MKQKKFSQLIYQKGKRMSIISRLNFHIACIISWEFYTLEWWMVNGKEGVKFPVYFIIMKKNPRQQDNVFILIFLLSLQYNSLLEKKLEERKMCDDDERKGSLNSNSKAFYDFQTRIIFFCTTIIVKTLNLSNTKGISAI